MIGLPLEQEPCRTDLFAKPLKTLAEFRHRHGNLVVDEIARPANGWPAMAHLERTLFVSPRGQGSGGRGQGSGGDVSTEAELPTLNTEPSVAGMEILAAAPGGRN